MRHQSLTQEEKVTYMTTKPVKGLVCEMAVPTIISMLVTSFYNMADTFFVGKINTQSTAAVGVVFSVMALIQALGFFLGQEIMRKLELWLPMDFSALFFAVWQLEFWD